MLGTLRRQVRSTIRRALELIRNPSPMNVMFWRPSRSMSVILDHTKKFGVVEVTEGLGLAKLMLRTRLVYPSGGSDQDGRFPSDELANLLSCGSICGQLHSDPLHQ
eukprot:TRINITY_DN7889_c0_g1_i1.p1 TRINITY_DN7889_c0_g1~~TRINITY_DN7889_c0_g1_i1.p1  ORF type:complete len:106 (-),score=19.19 TRINITY_DN7889_c0_g1_i1:89-406(-)